MLAEKKIHCNWLRASKLIVNFHSIVEWNPDFSSPRFLHPFSFPLDILLCNFTPESQPPRFREPIFASLGYTSL